MERDLNDIYEKAMRSYGYLTGRGNGKSISTTDTVTKKIMLNSYHRFY